MRRTLRQAAGVVAVLLAMSVPAAAQVWKNKPYTEWTEKDVARILSSSPWAKQVALKDVPQGAGGDGSRPGRDVVRLLWWSARAPRQATVRQAQLTGAPLPGAEAELLAEDPPETLQVRMESDGALVELAASLPEEALKTSAWLDVHGRNWRLHAREVEIVKDAGGRARQIIFHFSREVAGVPLVGPGTKRARFEWKLPKDAAPGLERVPRFEVTFHFGDMKLNHQQDW